MAVSIYPVLCVLLALSLFQVVLSQNFQNFQRPNMANTGQGGFNAPLQRGTRQQSLLSGGGRLSPQGMSGPGQRSGMMSPYSPAVAISSADAVLSHRSLGPSGRPLHAMAGGRPPMDRSQGSFSHVQDMSVGGNAMQGSPNPWNQPEVHAPGFIQSQGPLVASPVGGSRLDTFQQGPSMQPLNKMDALMINPSQAPTAATQKQMTEPLVPGYIAQSNAPLNQKPANQWPSKAPQVTAGPGGPVWTQGANQPLSTFPKSILIGTEPPENALLASSKPGYQPEAPIVPVKQKTFANKNKEAPLADVNTGSNTFAGEQQPLGGQFAHPADVKMVKTAKSVMADYSIIKDAGPMGPLLPGSPAPPTEIKQMYKSTPTDVRLQTGSPQYAVSMGPGITDIVYHATRNPVITDVPSTGFTDAWTTVVTTMPPKVTTTTEAPTTTTTEATTTNIYTRLSAIVMQEKLKKEKAKELAALRRALQDIGIPNTSGLYQRLDTLSATARKNILKRATLIRVQKRRSKTNRRTG